MTVWSEVEERKRMLATPNLFDPPATPERALTERGGPSARTTDAASAHAAARVVAPGNTDLRRRIWQVVEWRGPLDAFAIADVITTTDLVSSDGTTKPRWQHGTIRSAVCRAGLKRHDYVERNGRKVQRWRIPNPGEAVDAREARCTLTAAEAAEVHRWFWDLWRALGGADSPEAERHRERSGPLADRVRATFMADRA